MVFLKLLSKICLTVSFAKDLLNIGNQLKGQKINGSFFVIYTYIHKVGYMLLLNSTLHISICIP